MPPNPAAAANAWIQRSFGRDGSQNAPPRHCLTIRNGSIRILVVDDDIGIRAFVEKVLIRRGHQVDLASNGREAIEALATSAFSLVITDVCMPEADGLELLRAMRKRPSAPPVIAMSGGGRDAGSQYLRFASAFGAVATIRKPFTVEDLLGAIRSHEPGEVAIL